MLYKTAKIHGDICNTFVDIVRQKLSTLADFGQNSTQRKRWSKPEFTKNRPTASVSKCILSHFGADINGNT